MNKFSTKVLTASLGKTHLFSVGQAGYIIKSKNGQLLGIDMYLSECVERVEGHMGFKRLLPKILEPFELDFDCIIATHPHYDHFDMDAIPQLMSNNKTVLYASVECEKEVKRLNMTGENTYYVKPDEVYSYGDFEIEFVKCDHGDGAPDAVGVIVNVDGIRIYEAGDTCLHTEYKDDILKNGQIDVMIAPINGAYGNLNEQECVEFVKEINPKLTIPCHYGMFASHGGNPGLFYEIMTQKYPNKDILLMQMGEKITLN